LIEAVHGSAQELARLPDNALKGAGKIVAAQQGKLLATSFHPELSEDWRFHRYFMEMAR
jgi:5'-phosphate synthase pdxT subunit